MRKKFKNRDERMKDLRRYLDGKMTGRERNAFERKLQGDPFEEEALEGLSKLSSNELEKDMNILNARLKRRVHKRTPLYYRIAAAVVVLMAISSLLLVRELREPAMMVSENIVELKDTSEEEVNAPGVIAPGEAKEDISEATAGQAARREAVIENVQPDVKEVEIVDDMLAFDIAVEEEEVESVEAFNIEIKDSVNRSKGMVAEKEPVEARAIEGVEEAGAAEVQQLAETKAFKVEEQAKQASRAKKLSQPAAPVKAEEKADTELGGVAVMEDEAVSESDVVTDHPACPLGGMKEFRTYLETDQIFPADWELSDREIVKLEITIGRTGEIRDIKIIKSPGDQFSDEARRLILEGPPWMAASRDSEKIEDIVKLRMVFRR